MSNIRKKSPLYIYIYIFLLIIIIIIGVLSL